MPAQTYTITQSTFEAESGENISGGGNSTVTLVLAPTLGYTISSGSFTTQNLPAEVDSVVFSQAGVNINALVTFAAGFIMPAADVTLLIDIDGVATENIFNISGRYLTTETNTTTLSGITPFSVSGNVGDEITLFTRTFTADPGYYFYTKPYYYQDPAPRNRSNYLITWQDNALGESFSSRIYTVKYVVQNTSEVLNDIYFVAAAEASYVAPVAVVNSYGVQQGDWTPGGGSRNLIFYGDSGATFVLTEGINGFGVGISNLTIQDSGSLIVPISAGANSSGLTKVYTYTLSGNIASPFLQNNPIVINQPSS
jgi:hypothetical protein